MLCSRNFASFGVYKHHIGAYHGMLIEEYRAKFGKHGEVINRINCVLCKADLVHKHATIKMHLKSVHNLTILEYKRIQVTYSGEFS
jgi:predicted transcriptional regulator